MATVYEGRALSVGGFTRRVAIKYLHPHLLRDEQFVQMFLDEGKLAAQIHHPNVVAVLDIVHEPLGMYLVSEFVEGDQLLSLFKAARDAGVTIPAPVALRIMLDTLAGLHAAHELISDDGVALRIVHRDVSPHNILVGVDGITRLTDFGIAKAEERVSTTRDGIVKGKLSYMAPEQTDDQSLDCRADVFSAATVLWECLTGRRLFPGRTDREVLQALLHKPIPRLCEAAPSLPAPLDEVIAKALAREPAARFASAAAFADALERVALSTIDVASPREVSRYVETHAAVKLNAERERRRAMTTRELAAYRAGTPSQVRAVTSPPPPREGAVRTEPGLGPSPTRESDEAPTVVSAPHTVAQLRQSVDDRAPTTRVATPALPQTAAPKPLRVEERPRRAGLWLPVIVLLLGSALGYGIWTFVRPTAPRITATHAIPPHVTVRSEVPPPPAAAAQVAPPTPLTFVDPSAPTRVSAPAVVRSVRPRASTPARVEVTPQTPARAASPPAAPVAPSGPRMPRHI
jgi:serine/threonine-protein kinase